MSVFNPAAFVAVLRTRARKSQIGHIRINPADRELLRTYRDSQGTFPYVTSIDHDGVTEGLMLEEDMVIEIIADDNQPAGKPTWTQITTRVPN